MGGRLFSDPLSSTSKAEFIVFLFPCQGYLMVFSISENNVIDDFSTSSASPCRGRISFCIKDFVNHGTSTAKAFHLQTLSSKANVTSNQLRRKGQGSRKGRPNGR